VQELREERLNLEGALELCHQVGLPTGNADDLDSLVVHVRTVLDEMSTTRAPLEAECRCALTYWGEAVRERNLLAAAVRDAREQWTEDSGNCHLIWADLHATALALAAQIHHERPATPAEEE